MTGDADADIPLGARLGRASLWMALARGLVLLGSIGIVSFASRYLGGEGFGIFSAVNVFASMGALLLFGIPQAMVREVAAAIAVGDRERAERVQASGQATLAVLGVAGAALLAAVAPWLASVLNARGEAPDDVVAAARLGAVTLVIVALSVGPDAVLQGMGQYRSVALRNVSATVAGWACLVGVLLAGGGLRAAVATTFVTPAVALLLNLRGIAVLGRPALPRGASRAEAARLLRFGLPLFVNDATFLVQTQLDSLLLAPLGGRSMKVVGYYNAAMRVAVSTLIPPRLLVQPLFTGVTTLAEQGDHAKIAEAVRRVAGYIAVLVVPIVAGGIALAAPILGVLYPADFGAARSALVILLVGYGVNAVAYPYTAALLGLGRPRAITLNTVPTAVAILALHFLLIPSLGMEGAALGATIPVLAGHAFYPLQVASALGGRGHAVRAAALVPWTAFSKAAAAGIAMAFVVRLVPVDGSWFRLCGAIALGAAVYFGLLVFVLRGLTPADRKLVRTMFGGRAAA